jgi:hypothetical protein
LLQIEEKNKNKRRQVDGKVRGGERTVNCITSHPIKYLPFKKDNQKITSDEV